MEIVAYGVLADEEPLLRAAFDRVFAGRHELRCLGLFLNRDTAPTAVGHETVLSSVNDTLDTPGAGLAARGRNEDDRPAGHRLQQHPRRIRSPSSPGRSRWPSTGGSCGPRTAPGGSTSGSTG